MIGEAIACFARQPFGRMFTTIREQNLLKPRAIIEVNNIDHRISFKYKIYEIANKYNTIKNKGYTLLTL